MGCDIHLTYEIKDRYGFWGSLYIDRNIIPDDRNYKLFAFLANVRNGFNIIPQFAGRGFPSDFTLKYEFQDCDYHSRTYASLYEINNCDWQSVELDNSYFPIFHEYVLPRIISSLGFLSKEEEKNVRLVIFFDN